MSNLKRKRDADVPAECSSIKSSFATHQVFISHRGIEMKFKFASHLREALELRGIQAFLDMKDLPPGDDVRPLMLEAARAATIGLAIFTPNYAESRWCLDELVEMMESTTTKVIPVFYDVKSEDLRRDDGPFAKAIKDLREEGKHGKHPFTSWETALHKASWLEGFRLETYNQCEADLIKHLSAKVVEEVHNRIPVDAGPNTVGLQERVHHVVHLLRLKNQEDTFFILFWGMAGIGKTTLARDVYHKLRNKFDAASFVENWQDNKSVQDRLRQDLLHHQVVVRDDIARGRAILQHGLRGKRVLIVLDDMKEFASIEDAIDPKSLHPGSRILVTSRDRGLFPPKSYFTDVFRGELYEVGLLDHHESLRLLCCHAFKKPTPESGFEQLAVAAAEACGGLPLSLELLGRHLSKRREKEVWQEATKLSRTGIQGTMMASYNILSKDEQAMFLDVACFLIGELESSAKLFWDGLKYASSSGLNRLIDLCMVKVDEKQHHYHYGDDDFFYYDNENDDDVKHLTMHDLLRDFGRSIVRDESKTTRKWSRLWDDEDLSKVLRREQGLDEIRGIATSKKLNVGSLSQMHSLELLFLNTTESLDGSCEGPKAEIKWLKCPEVDLVEFFAPESLQVLDTGFSATTTRLPSNFGQLKSLTMLKLASLMELPEEFGYLESLEELDVRHTYITNLPSSFGQLK